ncbi:MAG: flagellar hook-basal body complex protein FliE [Planctomycetes bacterium]|nr:flagellar hook-basal body complex protein FliE [Planctomycetota bacterium]
MADPLGFVNGVSGVDRAGAIDRPGGGSKAAKGGPSFADMLRESLDEVNKAQNEATRAAEDLATGERADLEGVVAATQKADNAFRMLQSLRNKMVEAYDEIKQMRV